MLSYVNGDLLTDRFRDYNDGAFPLSCRCSPRCAAASGRPGAAVAAPLQPAGDFEGVTSAGCARLERHSAEGQPAYHDGTPYWSRSRRRRPHCARTAAARGSRDTVPRDPAILLALPTPLVTLDTLVMDRLGARLASRTLPGRQLRSLRTLVVSLLPDIVMDRLGARVAPRTLLGR